MHAIIEKEIDNDEELARAIFTLSAVAKEVLTAMRRDVETRDFVFQIAKNEYSNKISIKNPDNEFRLLCQIKLDEKYNFVGLDDDSYYEEIIKLANKINI